MKEDLQIIMDRKEDVIETTIELLLYVMKSQLFLDGNKRTAVLFANHYLMSQGYGLIVVPAELIEEYKKHLICYYENINDNIKTFLREKCLILIENQ